MSDVPHGPDWWRASNGLYYPPEATPGTRRPDRPDDGSASDSRPDADRTFDDMPSPPDDPEPVSGPTDPSPPSGPVGPPPGRRGSRRWIVVVVLLLLVILLAGGIGAGLLLIGSDDDSDAPAPTTTAGGGDQTITTPSTDEATTTTTTEDPGEVSAFDLGLGDCFDTVDVDDGEGLFVSTVVLVDCDEPHRAAVYEIATLDADTDEAFPGTDERDLAARAACEPGFEAYVGVSLAESELVMLWLAPTAESWDEGDREVVCAVAAEDELLTGSVEGSGR